MHFILHNFVFILQLHIKVFHLLTDLSTDFVAKSGEKRLVQPLKRLITQWISSISVSVILVYITTKNAEDFKICNRIVT